MNKLFRTKEISAREELKLKTDSFDISMNPREWMARFGHNVLVGDYRIFKFRDKNFDNWIHIAFKALTDEGLESLWKEFLTEQEINEIREQRESF